MPTTTHSWVKRTLSTVLAALCSVVRTPRRLLFVAWAVAFITIGSAQLAAADTDVLGNTTDGGQFWGIPLTSYTLPPLNLSDAHHGAPYLEEGMWVFFHAAGNVLLFLMLAFVRGAITAMQWMLNLTIYHDTASQIDTAVSAMASSLFWPLLGATAALAAITVIVKHVAGGQVLSELLWVIVAGVIAVGFMLSPSQTAGQLDEVRTAIGSAAATGYSDASGPVTSSAGLPAATYPEGREGAVNRLGDAMWNVYGVTPWCLASFGPDLSVCKDVGHELLQKTDRWKAIDASTHERGENDDDSPPCADELKGHCDTVRGQDYGQLGVILFLFIIGVGLGVLLLILVLYGVLALVEFLVLLMISPLALTACMIPGRPRAVGVRWGETLIATLLATIVITALIGAVMVLSGIFNGLLDTWGMFKVALINVAVFVAAFRVRSQFENLTGMRSSTGGMGNSYLAMKSIAGLSKAVKGLTKATAHGAAAGGRGAKNLANSAVDAIDNQIDNPNSMSHRLADAASHRFAQVRTYGSQAMQDRLGTPPAAPSSPVRLNKGNQLPPGRSAQPAPMPAPAPLAIAASPSTAAGASPAGRELPASINPQAAPSPAGWVVNPSTAVTPVTVVDSAGTASQSAWASHGHRSGDSGGQVSQAPRRAAIVDGAYVVTGAPQQRAARRAPTAGRGAPPRGGKTRSTTRGQGTSSTWQPAPPKGRDA